MTLPKLRITVEVEIWPGWDNEGLRAVEQEIQDPKHFMEHQGVLPAFLTDAEFALKDWDNYGTPKFEIVDGWVCDRHDEWCENDYCKERVTSKGLSSQEKISAPAA
jgi:hypothetical protein